MISETSEHIDYQVSWTLSTATDVSVYRVWSSEAEGFTPAPANLSSEGVTNSAAIRILKDASGTFPSVYWTAATIDVWGDDTTLAPEQLILGTQVSLVDDLDNDLIDNDLNILIS